MLTGSCLCGSVVYEVDASAGPIVHCHCSTCRKTHGAAFSTVMPVPRQSFRWLRGEELLSSFESSPGKLRRLRAATTAYYAAMEAMTTRLVPVVAMALDLPPHYFAKAFAEPNCTIRLIHYPPHPDPEENEFGFAPHTDNNFLTFLAQSALPGLEVRTAEGEWIRPPAVPGTFVVNTGAMLARYSNDRFRATPHRVINRNRTSRYAIPFFLAEPRFSRRLRPDLRWSRQPAALRADDLRGLYPAPADLELRPPPRRGRRREYVRARQPAASA